LTQAIREEDSPLQKEIALTAKYDFVIIDSAPGFRENTENVIKASDKVVVVLNPFLPDLSDALKILEVIKKNKKEAVIVVNRIKKKKYEVGEKQIKNMLDIKRSLGGIGVGASG
jgi:MinD-like ATPase involved in chromosome partitioning or flagellar assembly